jgi:hypothetical protein
MPRIRGSKDGGERSWHRLNLLKLSQSCFLDLREPSTTTIPYPVLNLVQISIGCYAEFAIQSAVAEMRVGSRNEEKVALKLS